MSLLYPHFSTARVREHHGKGVRLSEPEVGKHCNKTVSSGHDRASALMNAQKLWLPEQGYKRSSHSPNDGNKHFLRRNPSMIVIILGGNVL